MNRESYLQMNYNGMIPYSLELLKLQKEGLSLINSKRYPNKQISNDVINVKFKQKVRSGDEIIANYKKELDEIGSYRMEYIDSWSVSKKKEFIESYKPKFKRQLYLEKKIKSIESELRLPKWDEVKNEKLRERLYKDGFYINHYDKEGNVIKQDKYQVYKRSASKSRQGQVLFIKKHLHKEMKSWSRMYLKFDNPTDNFDLPSLLAYESLVSSSIETTIKIEPKNMLIISDVDSVFKHKANIIKNEDGKLISIPTEEATISNSLFDGSSLLESDYFPEGKGMMLLRNHMFKSAAFNTNIQQFLMDNCPDEIDYDDWQIKDLYDNSIYAKDVKFIFTPSSLKVLKFSKDNTKQHTSTLMYDYWKGLVEDEGSIFGVCKYDKPSKRGFDGDKVLNQTSYQILNSMPFSKEDIEELAEYEMNYIDDLKNNVDDTYINYLKKDATTINANEMFADLYRVNKDIAKTLLYKDFKKEKVRGYVKHVKKGKVRLNSDYAIMLGNGMEYLYHSIGKFDVNNHEYELKGNEVYTTLFGEEGFNKEYVGFRNPHTSQSNVLICKCKDSKDIKNYFNFTNNIIMMNSASFPVCDILSGSDWDSDSLLLVNDSKMLEVARKCFGKFNICVNKIDANKAEYINTIRDMAKIDNKLATSQKLIGKTVNLAQNYMSLYWHKVNNGLNGAEQLLHNIDVLTVLSGVCIDLAKKDYDMKIKDELDILKEDLRFNTIKNDKGREVKVKPMFWTNINKTKTKKNAEHDTAMDYLHNVLTGLPGAKEIGTVKLSSLLNHKYDSNKSDRKQKYKITNAVEDLQKGIEKVFSTYIGEDESNKDERNIAHEDLFKESLEKLKKLRVKPETMYDIIKRLDKPVKDKKKESEYCTYRVRLMNILYQTQTEVFLKVFKND